ncbi:hypothetical protein [Lysinibacillus agricola]|uniref:hypothetical protein n=1 Tax=Lysinibacillus agricola TaxID=2590012 RepID=UPI003C18CD85
MLKFRGFFLIIILLLTACTQDTDVPKEELQDEKNDENIVVTADGKITFEIINTIKVPQEKVESIKDELLHAYEDIQNSIHTAYVPSERIKVYLNEGYDVSLGLKSKIELFGIKENQYPLVHELTHSILGYGNNFDRSSGYFTQEGFADYMEEMYGKTKTSSHQFMKYFMDSNKLIPISKLIDPNQDDSYFRPNLTNPEEWNTLRWMSYTHSASFIKYLIDTYGLEKFEQIYNEKDLVKKIEDVYGKSVGELENDWLVFINNQTGLTYEEKSKMGYFYRVNSIIIQLDPKYFTKE